MAATAWAPAAQSIKVDRLPQNLVNQSVSALPTIIEADTSAATTPAIHTSSCPSSSRKYGCQA